MRTWLYGKALFVFWGTLGVYMLIWATVSYIGVYVTYVAGPVLLLSGLLAYSCAPKAHDQSRPED